MSVATIRVGRRKEPILGYVPKDDEKKNPGSKELIGKALNMSDFFSVELLLSENNRLGQFPLLYRPFPSH